MKKYKAHDVLFEDRVWALFARLGFEQMNGDRNFRIQYSKKPEVPGKQIDVFAADRETVLLVECKSSETRKKTSFSKDINEMGAIKEPIFNAIKKHFSPEKPKIAWIFATNNYIVNKPDRSRLDDNNILYFILMRFIKYHCKLKTLMMMTTKFEFQNLKATKAN